VTIATNKPVRNASLALLSMARRTSVPGLTLCGGDDGAGQDAGHGQRRHMGKDHLFTKDMKSS